MTEPKRRKVKTVKAARLAMRTRLHVCNMTECKECPRIKQLLDDLEAAVRADERNKLGPRTLGDVDGD